MFCILKNSVIFAVSNNNLNLYKMKIKLSKTLAEQISFSCNLVYDTQMSNRNLLNGTYNETKTKLFKNQNIVINDIELKIKTTLINPFAITFFLTDNQKIIIIYDTLIHYLKNNKNDIIEFTNS